jgi:hypothetical protein
MHTTSRPQAPAAAHFSKRAAWVVRTFLFLLGLVLLMGTAAEAPQAAGSPQAALIQAQRGIDEADSDLFNTVVDVVSVINKASDDLIVALKEQAVKGELGDSNIVVLLTLAASAEEAGQMALLRPLLITEVRNFVAIGINGGYFAGKPNTSVSPSRNSLAAVLKKMPEGRREIVPGKLLSQQDGKARMSATFNDPAAGGFPLELIVEQQKGGWRIVEIANAKELFHEAAKRNRK